MEAPTVPPIFQQGTSIEGLVVSFRGYLGYLERSGGVLACSGTAEAYGVTDEAPFGPSASEGLMQILRLDS